MSEISVQDAMDQLERAIREDLWTTEMTNLRDSDEYVRDVSSVAQKSIEKLTVFLSICRKTHAPRIFIGPLAEEAEHAGIYVSLESLLREEKEQGDADLNLWLDEMERLLKVFGRTPGG